MLYTQIKIHKLELHASMCIIPQNINRKEENKWPKNIIYIYNIYIKNIFYINLKIMQNNATYCLWMATYIIKEMQGNKYIQDFVTSVWRYTEGFISAMFYFLS